MAMLVEDSLFELLEADFSNEPLAIGSRAGGPKLEANGNLKPGTASMRIDPIVEPTVVDRHVVFDADAAPSDEFAAQAQSPDAGPDPDFVARIDQIRTVHRESNAKKYAAVSFTPEPRAIVAQATARHLRFDDDPMDHVTRMDNLIQQKSSRRSKNLCYAVSAIRDMFLENNEVESRETKQRIELAGELSIAFLDAYRTNNG